MAAEVEAEAVALLGAAQPADARLALEDGDVGAGACEVPRGGRAARTAAEDRHAHGAQSIARSRYLSAARWWSLSASSVELVVHRLVRHRRVVGGIALSSGSVDFLSGSPVVFDCFDRVRDLRPAWWRRPAAPASCRRCAPPSAAAACAYRPSPAAWHWCPARRPSRSSPSLAPTRLRRRAAPRTARCVATSHCYLPGLQQCSARASVTLWRRERSLSDRARCPPGEGALALSRRRRRAHRRQALLGRRGAVVAALLRA